MMYQCKYFVCNLAPPAGVSAQQNHKLLAVLARLTATFGTAPYAPAGVPTQQGSQPVCSTHTHMSHNSLCGHIRMHCIGPSSSLQVYLPSRGACPVAVLRALLPAGVDAVVAAA
jgi:hypothetical protein